MSFPNPSTALASVVIDELVRGGVRLVAASPGSRSTALAVAAAGHRGVDLVMAIDERSAGFHALGWSKVTGLPSVVVTTSGTAVANLTPAVVEADLAGVPLVVVSADRPPELRGVGANQTIDQEGMFDRFTRSSLSLGPAEDRPDAPRWWRSAVSQIIGAATGFGGAPGPVQLNISFREPTVPVSDDGRDRDVPYVSPTEGRGVGASWTVAMGASEPSPASIRAVLDLIRGARRGVVVAGATCPSAIPLAHDLGWPLVATAESGMRGRPGVVATGHHLAGRHRPEAVIRFGGLGPSRRTMDLATTADIQVVVSPRWSDPTRTAGMLVSGDSEATASCLAEAVVDRDGGDWLRWWREADRAVTQALVPELTSRLTEPAVAHALGFSGAPLLAVASSMPIRDVESFAFEVPPLVANRGASGIDGFVSLALGAARSVPGTVALTGDLSLLHDANGFLVEDPPPLVFVTVDNDGGGIFSFLPQAAHVSKDFERLFATPHRRDLTHLAELHGLAHVVVGDLAGLRTALDDGRTSERTTLVVAKTDRTDNVAEHQRLDTIAAEAVDGVSPLV